MNDCVWSYILNECGCKCKCNKYLSVNTEEGVEFLREYDNRINELLQPLRDEYKNKFENS